MFARMTAVIGGAAALALWYASGVPAVAAKGAPHAQLPPWEFRVNGVVRNVDAWYQAFDVKPGDQLYLPPAERVHIW
jgi:putative endopeptidase